MGDKDHFGTEGHEARSQGLPGSAAVKKEYDFSGGERGKFYRPDVELNIPVYLDPDVAKAVRVRARKTNTSIGTVVNESLRQGMRPRGPMRKLKAR